MSFTSQAPPLKDAFQVIYTLAMQQNKVTFVPRQK